MNADAKRQNAGGDGPRADAGAFTVQGFASLLDLVHDVAHSHAGSDAACLFVSHDESHLSEICPAMTRESAVSLLDALKDAGVDVTELIEPVRLYLPSVERREHALLLPLPSPAVTGVLVVTAPRPPVGRAGLVRLMELATNGFGWWGAAAETSGQLETATDRGERLADELAEMRVFVDLQAQLVQSRTTADLVARLANWLDAAVAVQMPNLIVAEAAGPDARELALSTQRSELEQGIVSRSTNRGRLPIIPASGRLPARVVAPIDGNAGEFAGFLIAGVGGRGAATTRRAVELALGLVAYQLSIRQDVEQSVASLRQNLLTDLLTDRFTDDHATQAAKLGHDLSAVHIPLAVAPLRETKAGPELATADADLLVVVRRMCAQASATTAASLVGIVEGMVVALVPEPVPAGSAALGEAIRTEAADGGLDVIVGIGPPSATPGDIPSTADRARWAVQVIFTTGVPEGTRVAEFDDLGIYGILFDHNRAADLAEFAQRWLGPLLEYDDKHRSELTETLRQIFRQRSLADTSAALHIHISTLKYRIGRIEKILDMSIESWDNIFHLELALRILAINRHVPPAGTQT